MSSEKEDAQSALAAAGVGAVAKEAYIDLVRPAARLLGKELETVARAIGVAMAPVRGLVWGLEKVQDWLAASLLKKLAGSRPEDIQTPPSYVAGQVLLQLQFCADQDELRELYANLLATAMLKDSVSSIHPAFVHVVQQLAPDEALILGEIARRGRDFALQELVSLIHGECENKEGPVSTQFWRVCARARVGNIALSDAYLDNLLRLKLLSEREWREGELKPVSGWPVGAVDATVANIGRVVTISAFGEHFIKACVQPSFRGWSIVEPVGRRTGV